MTYSFQNILLAIFIINVSSNQFLVQTLCLYHQTTFSKDIDPFEIPFCFYKALFHNKLMFLCKKYTLEL